MNKLEYETIHLSQFEGNWMFFDEDIPVKEGDYEFIKPLTQSSSENIWNKFICTKEHSERHLCLMNDEHFLKKHLLNKNNIFYQYKADWENNNYDDLRNELEKRSLYSKNEEIFVMYMQEEGIVTNWEIFIKYWINFLFFDDAVIVFSKNHSEYLLFNNGTLRIVLREGNLDIA